MIAIVSHDAGGAELLSSYVRRNAIDCRFALAGPALSVFERKLGPLQNLPVEAAVSASSSVLCGTSWPADHELGAIGLARAQGKSVTAFLDHWINYRERFERNGCATLPDEIWVADQCAARIARDAFPELPMCVVDNPYRCDMEEALRAQRVEVVDQNVPGLRVLYVSEPLSEHAQRLFGDSRHWGYTETEALRYFLAHLPAVGAVGRVVVRPHPSENDAKYMWAAGEADDRVLVRSDRSLLEEIAAADVVVGCNSMAMMVGLWGDKRVICSIPPAGRGFALPDPRIESLAKLIDRAQEFGSVSR